MLYPKKKVAMSLAYGLFGMVKPYAGMMLLLLLALRPAYPLQAQAPAFNTKAFKNAHIGIAVYDPAAKKYVYELDSDKNFIPASTMKIFTLYAALSVLKDSMPGVQYERDADTLYLFPTGDPSFLHRNYPNQPVFDFLKQETGNIVMSTYAWKEHAYGVGWSWDDYETNFMAEKSPFPVYNNMIRWYQQRVKNPESLFPEDADEVITYSEPEINWQAGFRNIPGNKKFQISREFHENRYYITEGLERNTYVDIPFITDTIRSGLELLQDSLGRTILVSGALPLGVPATINSRPLDSILIPMMHESDNFFAEQLLLASSFKQLGRFSDSDLIKHLLAGPLAAMPDKPRWVDGSGLSRYNLVSPRSMVWLLNKMQAEVGLERLKSIFPTSGQGTLAGYYAGKKGKIFAKTGTMSNQLALSGYFFTKQNKLMLFSVMINNHLYSASALRREIERFINSFP